MSDPDQDLTTPSHQPPPSGTAFLEPGVPARIGRYVLRRRIASGGMGTVYEAIQEEPRRPVALKVVKHDFNGPEALRRFQVEVQILARLRHPAIAQIYEAGTHDEGNGSVPFFAMEYIPNAKSITEFAESRKLGLRERLALFAVVCDAVHHGHQKGVIHRDLKPGNILVDSSGNPHIIDFGVARATDTDLVLATVQTEVGQLVGSVAYMSPEQFDADPSDIDTRSDVYALGVVLYELLGGRLPYDVLRTRVFEAARVVREDPPLRLGDLNHATRGEVETIVHKALEKERDRRYQSAFGLAEDIRRYLAGQAIAAKPPSIGYHIRVFARRNKVLLAAVAAIFVVLVLALAGSTSLYLRAERERQRAEREQARSRAATDFITSALESVTPPSYNVEPTVDDLMQRLSSTVDGAFPDDPGVEAEIRMAIARGTLPLAETHSEKWQIVEDQLQAALALRESVFGPNATQVLEAQDYLATLYGIRGRNEELAAMRRSIYASLRATAGERDPKTLEAAAGLVEALGELPLYEEAEALAVRTLEARRQVLGPNHLDTLMSRVQLAWIELLRGHADRAEIEASQIVATCRQHFGNDHELTRIACSELAAAKIVQGKLDEAQAVYGNRRVPADLEAQIVYQGTPVPPRQGTQLFVYWEVWCPFSQQTVPSLEAVHHRFRSVGVLGLTGARPPATDAKVVKFLTDTNVTYPMIKVDRSTAAALDAHQTPWLVLARDGFILWESNLGHSTPLVSTLLEGVMRKTG